jgi:hypothetical protein
MIRGASGREQGAAAHIFAVQTDSELEAPDLKPLQVRTGSRGYFGNFGSDKESWHITNCEPRSEVIVWA